MILLDMFAFIVKLRLVKQYRVETSEAEGLPTPTTIRHARNSFSFVVGSFNSLRSSLFSFPIAADWAPTK